jgi:hypothetical protein
MLAMNKLPTFLLAENPLVDDERIFIIHSKDPMVLAEAIHFSDDSGKFTIDHAIDSSLHYRDEYIVLAARVIAGNPDTDRLAKLMRRMADWYRAYLIFEDQDETQN